MKIIIIDDEKEIRDMQSRVAAKEFSHAEILTAADYKTALRLISESDWTDTWYILDGDIGESKTGVDILKEMDEEQRARTVFTSGNQVHQETVMSGGYFCWNKMDFINGLKKLIDKRE